jgi:hypothetical protein
MIAYQRKVPFLPGMEQTNKNKERKGGGNKEERPEGKVFIT